MWSCAFGNWISVISFVKILTVYDFYSIFIWFIAAPRYKFCINIDFSKHKFWLNEFCAHQRVAWCFNSSYFRAFCNNHRKSTAICSTCKKFSKVAQVIWSVRNPFAFTEIGFIKIFERFIFFGKLLCCNGVIVKLVRVLFGEGACVWAVLSARCRFRPSSKSSSRSRRGCANTPSTFKVSRAEISIC